MIYPISSVCLAERKTTRSRLISAWNCPNCKRVSLTSFHPPSCIETVKAVTVISHPLVQHNLTRLRDKRTGPQEFRRVLSEVAALMLYEATRSFGVEPLAVRTPLGPAKGFNLKREVLLVPVLRAGLGML